MQKFTQSVHVGSPVQPLVPLGINVMHSDANTAARRLVLCGVIMQPTVVGSKLTFDLELGTNTKTPPPFVNVCTSTSRVSKVS